MGVGRKDMSGPDRLGNPLIDFPICIVFGDNDFFGSEGSDKIIRNNKHFKIGRSQLLIIENSTHLIHIDRPNELAGLMIEFYEGDSQGRFQEKKWDEAALPFAKEEKGSMMFYMIAVGVILLSVLAAKQYDII